VLSNYADAVFDLVVDKGCADTFQYRSRRTEVQVHWPCVLCLPALPCLPCVPCAPVLPACCALLLSPQVNLCC